MTTTQHIVTEITNTQSAQAQLETTQAIPTTPQTTPQTTPIISPAEQMNMLTPSQWEALETKLRSLKLYGLIQNKAALQQVPETAVLLDKYCGIELKARQEKSFERRMKAAKVPYHKPMASFDWQWLQTPPERIKQLFTLDFTQSKHNVMLFGEAGTGKSMIASNLAVQALEEGLTVYYTTAKKVLEELQLITHGIKLRNKLKKLASYDLLIIDELGYGRHNGRQAELLYEIISNRHREKSTIIISHLMFNEWQMLFENSTMVIPIIDRLVEKCERVKLEGKSYRVKNALINGNSTQI